MRTLLSLLLVLAFVAVAADASARTTCPEFRDIQRDLLNQHNRYERDLDNAVNQLHAATKRLRAAERRRQGDRRIDVLRNVAQQVRVAYRKMEDSLIALETVESELDLVEDTLDSFCTGRRGGGYGGGGSWNGGGGRGDTQWGTDYGDLELPSGPNGYVTAYYDNGKFITGTFQNGHLIGYWYHENASGKCPLVRGTRNWGRFDFNFNNNYTRFNGRWGFCHNPNLDQNWDGRRK